MTYAQVIASIRKEFKCSREQALEINHQRNLGKIAKFTDDIKATPGAKEVFEKHYGRKFNW
jgi:hypothetical protein